MLFAVCDDPSAAEYVVFHADSLARETRGVPVAWAGGGQSGFVRYSSEPHARTGVGGSVQCGLVRYSVALHARTGVMVRNTGVDRGKGVGREGVVPGTAGTIPDPEDGRPITDGLQRVASSMIPPQQDWDPRS